MTILPFKTAETAFEYVEEYFTTEKIQFGQIFTGIVKFKKTETNASALYGVEIATISGKIFKKKTRALVAAMPENGSVELNEGDLVKLKIENATGKVPAAIIICKCTLELNLQTGEFTPIVDERENTKMSTIDNDIFAFDTEHKFGKVIQACEFLEDQESVYVTYRRSDTDVLTAKFNKSSYSWGGEVDRLLLDGLNFISTMRFSSIVIQNMQADPSLAKSAFVEFCFFGLPNDQTKSLSVKLRQQNEYSFELNSSDWNLILLGQEVVRECNARSNIPQKNGAANKMTIKNLKIYFNSDGYAQNINQCLISEIIDDHWGEEEIELVRLNTKDFKGYYL